MNIKRFIVIGLCLSVALSITVFAEIDPDAYWYPMENGSYGYDQEAYEHDLAVDMVQTSGIDLDPELYWAIDPNSTVSELYYYDFDAFKAAYDALMPDPEPDPEPETTPDPYPVEWPKKEVVEDEVISDLPIDESLLENTESDPVLELGENTPMVYTLNDMRASGDTGETVLLDGLKAVIRTIFGTYEPVTTTAVYIETVDGETVTTLVDVVAAGTAGVDYEYIAGVFLFGIMLFCMFKLLGGIMS